MTLQQLQYLSETAKYGSITQAAEALFVSQSAVSKSIRALEEELGIKLMKRERKGVVFTPEGLSFLRDSYKILMQLDSMKNSYSGKSSRRKVLRISSQHYIFALTALLDLVNSSEKDKYAFSLHEEKTTEIIRKVFARESDIGFVYYYENNRDTVLRELQRMNLDFHSFCTAVPHAYLSASHPLAVGKSVTLNQLSPYPYICYDYDTDPVGFAEDVLPVVHPDKSLLIQDRHTLFSLLSHTESYSLGSGDLEKGITPDDVISLPVSDASGSVFQMVIGWIVPAGTEPDEILNVYLDRCRKAILGNKDSSLKLTEEETK